MWLWALTFIPYKVGRLQKMASHFRFVFNSKIDIHLILKKLITVQRSLKSLTIAQLREIQGTNIITCLLWSFFMQMSVSYIFAYSVGTYICFTCISVFPIPMFYVLQNWFIQRCILVFTYYMNSISTCYKKNVVLRFC